MIDTILEALNTPLAISIIAGALGWVLLRVYKAKPLWEAYEGTIISAVRWAEKVIDDDTENAGMKKLDEALKYVVGVYETYTGKKASAKVEKDLKEGIQIIHNVQDIDEELVIEEDEA